MKIARNQEPMTIVHYYAVFYSREARIVNGSELFHMDER